MLIAVTVTNHPGVAVLAAAGLGIPLLLILAEPLGVAGGHLADMAGPRVRKAWSGITVVAGGLAVVFLDWLGLRDQDGGHRG